jgi:anhydro-N-acetylmuramic acid kinase
MTFPLGLYAGVMTGTSMDGIDLSLIAVEKDQIRRLDFAQAPFPEPLRRVCGALHDPMLPQALLHSAEASLALARAIADLVASRAHAWRTLGKVQALGVHGQTVLHQPDRGITIQLNAPALIAEVTGLDVVSDFRSRDLAAGGQGAPLVPLFHEAITRRDNAENSALINLGGIANITSIRRRDANGRGLARPAVVGFDTGPANILLDLWAQRVLGSQCDLDGALARQAAPVASLVALMAADPYFALPAPKSTGRDQFNSHWLEAMLAQHEARHGTVSDAQVQASLVALTAQTVAAGIPKDTDVLYLCGGGAKNPALRDALDRTCKEVGCAAALQTTEALGWPLQEVESAAFAWLAYRCVAGEPGNLPEVTGARGPRILGSITRAS